MNAVEELRAKRQKMLDEQEAKMLAAAKQMVADGVKSTDVAIMLDGLASEFLVQTTELEMGLNIIEAMIKGRQEYLDRMRSEVLDTMDERFNKKFFEILEESGHGYGEA